MTTETSIQNPGASEGNNLSRREFLNLSGLAVGSFGLSNLPSWVKNGLESKDPQTETIEMIAGSIEKELGLTTDDVKFTMMFGNHVIQEDHMEVLEGKRNLNEAEKEIWGDPEPYDAILGEVGDGVIYGMAPKEEKFQEISLNDIVNRIKHPGIGASQSELDYHYSSIRKLIEKGKSLYITDGAVPSFLFKDGSLPLSSAAQELISTSITLAGVSAFAYLVGKRLKNKGMERDAESLKTVSAVFSTILTGYLIEKGKESYEKAESDLIDGRNVQTRDVGDYVIVPADEVKTTEDLVKIADNSRVLLDKLREMYDEGIDPLEVIVDIRNKIMALNSWCAISDQCTDQRGLQRIAFFAGNGHVNSFFEFLRGPAALEAEIKGLIEDFISEVDGDPSSPSAMLLETFNTYSRLSLSATPDEKRKSSYIPKDVRTILLEALGEEIVRTPQGERLENLKNIRRRFSYDTVTKTYLSIVGAFGVTDIGETRLVEDITDNLEVLRFGSKELDGNHENIHSWLPTILCPTDRIYEISIGIVKHNGRYMPLFLYPKYDSDGVVRCEVSVATSLNNRIVVGKSSYVPKEHKQIKDIEWKMFVHVQDSFITNRAVEDISQNHLEKDLTQFYMEKESSDGLDPFKDTYVFIPPEGAYTPSSKG